MAAVSLKDLMNPLVKIEEYTNQTSQKLDKVIMLLASGGNPTASGGGETKVDKNNVEALKALGSGIGPLIKSLALLKLVPSSSVDKLADIITKIGESLSSIKNPSDALKVAELISIIGNNVLLFAISLSIATPLLIFSIPGAVALGLSIRLLFMAMGDIDEKRVDNLKRVVYELSLGIGMYSLVMAGVYYGASYVIGGAIAFGLSVRLLVLAAGAGFKGMAKMAAIGYLASNVLEYSLTMALTAVLSPLVIIGSVAFGLSVRLLLIAMGKSAKSTLAILSIGILGQGVLSFVLTMALVGFIAPYMLKGTLIFTASLMILSLGLKLVSKPTSLKGVIALALIGPALVLFALSVVAFSAIIGSDPTVYITPLLIIGGIAIIFTLIGKQAMNIALGALVFAAIGLSLFVFNLGYIPFIETIRTLTPADLITQAGVLAAFGLGSVGLGLAIAATGGAAFLAPLLYAAAGVSLIALAEGLKSMKSVSFDQSDAENLGFTLGAVAMAFSGVNPEEGLFKNIGNVFTKVVQAGAGVAGAAFYTAAGISLLTLSKGLTAFKEIKFTEEDSKELALSLSAITTGFALAGGAEQVPSTSAFGQLFGFKANVVQEGIKAVMNAGKALKSVADGLIAFQGLINQNVKFGEPDAEGRYEEGTLGYAITNTLGFVQSAFASIGREGDETDTGLFGALGFKQNIVKKGIQAVRGAGTELTNIANGLKTFQGLVESQLDFSPEGNLAKAVSQSLTFIGDAFSVIGGQKQETSWLGFKWDENKVAAGVKAVRGAGTELTNIANGLKTFQGLVENNIDFSKGGSLARAVSQSITFVGEAFAAIGGQKQKTGWFVFKWDQNKVNAGIKAVKGAGTELNNIATGLTKFDGIEDPEALGKKISTLFTSMSTAFTSLYATDPKINDKMSKVATFVTKVGDQAMKGALQKAADGFQGIADAINSVELDKANAMGDLFKGASKLSSDAKAYQKLVEAVEEIRDILSKEGGSTGSTGGGGFMQSILPTAPTTAAPTTAAPAGTDGRLLSALERINSTMANLPSQIAAIEIKVRD
jgi:hypothetical protein